jgi:hypothetical protein
MKLRLVSSSDKNSQASFDRKGLAMLFEIPGDFPLRICCCILQRCLVQWRNKLMQSAQLIGWCLWQALLSVNKYFQHQYSK